ncbi:MAG: carbon-nitrogen hydrolase family protein [Chthoniobacterales bacterium]
MKVAAAQISCAVGDADANLRKIEKVAARAAAAGAAWIVFPEMSDTGYVMSVICAQAARWSDGPVPRLQALARKRSLGIICGVSERTDECIFNAQVAIDAAGQIVGRYRKAHLFSPAPIAEHECFAPGGEFVVLPAGAFRFGLSICYDLRFPEFHRHLACDERADVLVISSAWPFPRVEHLRILATARAIENQCYVILSNRVGTDDGVTFCGSSAIIDPSGAVLASAPAATEELLFAEITPSAVHAVRERMPVFEHRRRDLY